MIDKDLVKRHFSANAANYDCYARVQKQMAKALTEIILKRDWLKSDRLNILDIGCGTGYLTKLLHEKLKSPRIMAVDIAEGMILEARKNFWDKDVEFRCEDIEEAEIKENYDLIVSNAAFQWFNALDETVAKLCNALNSKGILLFSTFGSETFKELNNSFETAKSELEIADDLRLGQKFSSLEELLGSLEKVLNKTGKNYSITGYEYAVPEYFDSVREFLDSVKKIGANNSNKDSQFKSPKLIRRMMELYEKNHREDSGIKATYHCIYIMIEKIN